MSSPDPVRHRYVARALLFPYPQSAFKSRKKNERSFFLLTDLAASLYKEDHTAPEAQVLLPRGDCRQEAGGIQTGCLASRRAGGR
jgi:hypothetical protein